MHRLVQARDVYETAVDRSRVLLGKAGLIGARLSVPRPVSLFTPGSAVRFPIHARHCRSAHYDHPCTGRILNLPRDDTLSFRRSSPIFFADGLEDPLVMLHGMVETNVHYQDIVRLAQQLIELGKTGWELASYPVENHGFVRPDSWTLD